MQLICARMPRSPSALLSCSDAAAHIVSDTVMCLSLGVWNFELLLLSLLSMYFSSEGYGSNTIC